MKLSPIHLVVGALLAAAPEYACTPPATSKEAAAEATYGGQLQACVDKAKTKPEVAPCWSEVNKRWGIVDGGASHD